MSRKRRTREQKIIARLRRELKKQSFGIQAPSIQKEELEKKTETKEEPITFIKEEKTDKELFNYDPVLIKKDLKKTLILSVVFTLIIILIKKFSLL